MSLTYKTAFFLSNKMGKGLPLAIKAVATLLVLSFAGAVVHLVQDSAQAPVAIQAKQAEPAKPVIVFELTKEEKAQAEKAEKARKAEAKKHGVSLGDTEQQALESNWGKPKSINTTTTPLGTTSQWVYGNRHYLYFKNGVLTAVQN